jgi:predicted nuclease of predicted toxin-antitoxin system
MSAKDKRVLVTIDTDFGDLIYIDRAAHTGLVRLPDVPAETRIKIMGKILKHHESDLKSYAIITVRGDRIRISKPPG